MLCAWGCIGITQSSFGFHNAWEFWAYQAFYGIFVCPWYAISVGPGRGLTLCHCDVVVRGSGADCRSKR